jgi:hypothetical protein
MEDPYSYKKCQWRITARPRISTQAQAPTAKACTFTPPMPWTMTAANLAYPDPGSLAAGLDEGLLSLCLPHSDLYGESK